MPYISIDTILWTAAILLFATVLYLAAIYPGKRSRTSKKAIPNVFYAHRGLWDDEKPENSMPAFLNATEHGFGIEIDLHLTKDEYVVAFHDDDTKRMCGVDKDICDLTLSEIQQLRLLDTNENIPLLSEVLTLVDGKVPLIIELKCATVAMARPLCERVAAILDNYDGIYCIESFNPLVLLWCKKNRPSIIRGQLADAFLRKCETCTPMYFVLQHMLFNILTKPDFIAYNAQNSNALAFRIIKLFRPTTIAWTIRTQDELNECKRVFDRFIFECFMPDHDVS